MVTALHGDSREVLKTLADGSLDACVCDPPYALVSIGKRFFKEGAAAPTGQGSMLGAYARASAGFMGKAWDTGETAFDPAFWREVLRVLKPGAHVIAFGGTRSYHRLACAIEDAGFEVRDMVAWLYGSGFPKSHDVARGVDAIDAAAARRERALRFTAWLRSTGVTAKRINQLTDSFMGSHYLTEGEQPEIPTRDQFDLFSADLPPTPDWALQLIAERTVESENLKAREVVGEHGKVAQAARWRADYQGGEAAPAGAITKPFTEDAQAWEGWGTALKPALEPCVLARKPLIGTVAANVLAHGVGALNVDGCRIEGETWSASGIAAGREALTTYADGLNNPGRSGAHGAGRWPANVCHDGSAEAVAGFPDQESGGYPPAGGQRSHVSTFGEPNARGTPQFGASEGSAARFFYTAKADAEDRHGSKHPTVKPVSLMRWLCRLVTPPGGVILDPFAGSGTTGLAALAEGFDAVLIEREAEYFADIQRRLAWARGEGGHAGQVRASRKPQAPDHGELFASLGSDE